MRTSLHICAAVAAIALGSAHAAACDDDCGSSYYYSGYNGYNGYGYNGYGYNGYNGNGYNGYGYNGYGYNGYGYNGNGYNGYNGNGYNGNGYYGDGYDYDDDAPPYNFYGAQSAFGFRGPRVSFYGPNFYGPNFYGPASYGYRRPRWDRGGCARYYAAPVVYRRRWRRSRGCRFNGYYGRTRHYARPYRAYTRGPIVRVRGEWRRW